ncbi:MAG: dihydropteroate synthase [Candidatus Dormibacteria bacterium]
MTDAATAARYNVRPLLPGPEDALREAVERLGSRPERLSVLARHGSSEALAVEGLSADLTRVLERELAGAGGAVLSDAEGRRAVLLAPVMTMGALPAALRAWSTTAEGLAGAIADVLMSRAGVPPPLHAGRHLLRFDRTLVMGIVNVTPDSFAGDSVTEPAAAADRARALAADGADIIDVGGESTRPNSAPVDEDEELRRAIPAVAAIVAAVDLPVSIDTRKAAVARAAVDAGARIVNDVWGLRGDPAMASVVAAREDVGLVAMHNQVGTDYADLVGDITRALRESLRIAAEHGISPDRVVVDPGFGFAKTPAQNLEVVRRLGELRGLGRAILLGVSRKHTIGVLTGAAEPRDRDEGSVALAALGVANGASMVRVHNVRSTVPAVRVADALVRGAGELVAGLPAPGVTG